MRHEKLGLTKLLCNIFYVRNRHQKINSKIKGRFVYVCCTHATSPLLWPSILRTFLVLCRSDGPYQNDRRCQQIAMVPSNNGFVCRQIFAFLFQFKPSFLEVPKCCVNGHLYTILGLEGSIQGSIQGSPNPGHYLHPWIHQSPGLAYRSDPF